jgi:CheY-like chemotaxis protein
MTELRRILLAEDSPEDIELTLAALAEYRLANQIDVVRDGVEVLDYLYKRGEYANRPGSRPGVLLLDLKMPRMSGIEVLRHLKSDPVMKTLPIVMLTSSREEADIITSYDLGVNAYVVKPVEFTDFMDALRQLGAFWAVLNEVPRASAPIVRADE